MKKHIVSFSGGKDSTAMLIRMVELGMQIDEILYFDCGNWEFPQMKKHIDRVEEYISMKITRLHPKIPFDELFLKYSFPQFRGRWCTSIKMNALDKGHSHDIRYIGFSYDEMNRMNKMKNKEKRKKLRFPLIEWGWTEKDCLAYCCSKGFDWGGLYKYFKRVSCWCCPFQNLNNLRKLRKLFPDLWEKLLNMQKISRNTFKNGITMFDLEKKFELEDKQKLNLL